MKKRNHFNGVFICKASSTGALTFNPTQPKINTNILPKSESGFYIKVFNKYIGLSKKDAVRLKDVYTLIKL